MFSDVKFHSMKIWKLLRFLSYCLLHVLQIPWIYIDISEPNWVSTVILKMLVCQHTSLKHVQRHS